MAVPVGGGAGILPNYKCEGRSMQPKTFYTKAQFDAATASARSAGYRAAVVETEAYRQGYADGILAGMCVGTDSSATKELKGE